MHLRTLRGNSPVSLTDNDPGPALALLHGHCLLAQFAGPRCSSNKPAGLFLQLLKEGSPCKRLKISHILKMFLKVIIVYYITRGETERLYEGEVCSARVKRGLQSHEMLSLCLVSSNVYYFS